MTKLFKIFICVNFLFCVIQGAYAVESCQYEDKSIDAVKLPQEDLKLESTVKENVIKSDSDNLKIKSRLYSPFEIISKDGLELEGGIVKNVKLGLFYEGTMSFIKPDDRNLSSKYDISTIELSLRTKFRDDKTDFRFVYNFARDLENHSNDFTEKLSEFVLTRKITDHQRVQIGQGSRLPIGVEGSLSINELDMASRSMLGRTFSNVRSYGVRYLGDYDYIDYDIGIFDSTRYLEHLFNGAEFAGWVNFKPLAKIEDKYGKLTIGTGCNVGSYNHDYSVFGAYLGYDYKRFHNKFEYAYADGYNGIVNSPDKAEGFYNTILFDITPKIQLVGRYDFFNPNKHEHDSSINEYTLGFKYKLNENITLLLNYGYRDREIGADDNMIMFVTRFLI